MMDSKHSEMCQDKASLIAYLYEESDAGERHRVEAHVATCPACARELDALRAVRNTLANWAPPEPAPDFRLAGGELQASPRRWRDRWLTPVWALASAAALVLVLALGAAVANLTITYGPGGLLVRTGWSDAPAAATSQPGGDGGVRVPWRAELAALEVRLRREFSAAGADRPVVAGAALLQQVRHLIVESEKRQQRSLALRMSDLVRDVDVQREADLLRIEQQFGQLEGLTEADVVQHREIMNYLVRVTEQR